jgi:hypothetical protein
LSFIPFSEFATNVRSIVFPEGEAENLVAAHNSYIKDALINLQTFVPCLRDNNVDFYHKEDMQEWCNVDIFTAQRGVIHAVYAFEPGTDCKKFFYDPKSTAFIDQWIDRQKCTSCGDSTDPDISRSPYCHDNVLASDICEDADYSQADESDCPWKNSNRYYAVGPNHKLYLAPRIPCDYVVAVHWEGQKRKWDDSDPVPDDDDLVVAVSKFVLAQRAIFLDHDTQLYDRIMHPLNGEFSLARADLIHRCNRERRIQARHQALSGFDVLQPFFYDPLPYEADDFAYTADWGQPGSNLTMVDDLIESWSPSFIVLGGDNKYSVTMATALAAAPFIESKVGEEEVYPAIGNHDLSDGGGLADFLATFDYINYNATRNYSIRKNHVEFFFMETHDSGTAPPDLTAQENWLASALAASNSTWKVVVTQDPPFCSDEGLSNYPGHEDSQLDYAGLGADIVLSGDSHFYERLLVDGFPYIICGLGGATKNGFHATPATGSLVRYNTLYGAIKGRAEQHRLALEFYNTAGELIDQLILRK